MKNLILLTALISLFMIGIVNAAPQLTIDTATWSLNTLVNISTKSANDGSLVNMTFVTVRISSPTTANSSTVNFFNITNTTATNFNFGYANFTVGFDLILEDSADYSATAISTGVGDADAVTSSATTISLDRTVPSQPTTAHAANKEFTEISGSNIITYTVEGNVTSSCRIAFGKTIFTGSNTFAMTHSGNTCTYTIKKGTIPDGTYRTYAQASDGTNTSSTNGIDFKIKTLEGVTEDDISAISIPIVKQVIGQQINLGMVVLVIIFGAFVYMAFVKKK